MREFHRRLTCLSVSLPFYLSLSVYHDLSINKSIYLSFIYPIYISLAVYLSIGIVIQGSFDSSENS